MIYIYIWHRIFGSFARFGPHPGRDPNPGPSRARPSRARMEPNGTNVKWSGLTRTPYKLPSEPLTPQRPSHDAPMRN